MGRSRPQFTIGRGMIGVAVAAVLCWLATFLPSEVVAIGLIMGVPLACVMLLALACRAGLVALVWVAALLLGRLAPSSLPLEPSSTDRNSP